LGLRSGIVDSYQQSASTKQVWANVEGTFIADSSSANGKYFIISQVGNEFVLLSRSGIYQTGATHQIDANKLVTEVGISAQQQVLPLNFAEEEVLPKLVSIAQSHPSALILISGALTIDSPEEISIAPKPGQLEVVKLSANQLVFNYCPLSQIIGKLSLQFGSGNVQLKIITPAPKL
jgi:hypothetical protein